jgi:uncharacterized protein
VSLRLVFDTSTLVGAALKPDSIPDRALRFGLLFHRVYSSARLLDEMKQVLGRGKFDTYVSLESRLEFLERFRRDSKRCRVRQSAAESVSECRDPADRFVLALALAANADALVSSDQDLLVLHPWRGIPILTPAQFLSQFRIEEP